jgi:hypothetical protein
MHLGHESMMKRMEEICVALNKCLKHMLSHSDHYAIKPHNPPIETSPSLQPIKLPYPSLSESSIDPSYHPVNPTSSPPSPLCLAIITQTHSLNQTIVTPPPIISSFPKKSYHQGYVEVQAPAKYGPKQHLNQATLKEKLQVATQNQIHMLNPHRVPERTWKPNNKS